MKLANAVMVVGMVLIPALGLAREEPAPDMEMLEFLGGFETAGGKPVDPLGFADYAAKDTKKGQTDGAKRDRKRGRKPDKQEQQEQKERDNEK